MFLHLARDREKCQDLVPEGPEAPCYEDDTMTQIRAYCDLCSRQAVGLAESLDGKVRPVCEDHCAVTATAPSYRICRRCKGTRRYLGRVCPDCVGSPIGLPDYGRDAGLGG